MRGAAVILVFGGTEGEREKDEERERGMGQGERKRRILLQHTFFMNCPIHHVSLGGGAVTVEWLLFISRGE